MLFSEFQENTGCKDNDYNYKLYKRLEIIYMNDDTVSKQDIYDMGKKLADNSKSEAELILEAELNTEIADCKKEIAHHKAAMDAEKTYCNPNKAYIKYCREQIKFFKRRIAECRWIMGEQ